MTLLLDRLLAFGVDETTAAAVGGVDLGRLTGIPVLDAQTAVDYFFMGTEQEEWHLREDFPCVAAPWPQSWIEFRIPNVSRSAGRIVPLPGRLVWGFLVEQRSPDALLPYWPDHFQEAYRETEARWILSILAYVESGHYRVEGRFTYRVALDPEGRVCEMPRRFAGSKGRPLIGMQGLTNEEDGKYGQALLNPLCFALSLMHCKNVVAEPVMPPAALSRAHERRTGRPLLRYHVLNVDPFKEVARSEGAGTSGIKKALHICRGHFATYTEDKPLFGRLTGTFWKPQHLRGAVTHGVVAKDYRIARADSSGA